MTVDYKNSTIHYSITGTGDCILLLHGFLENSNMWNAFLPQLSEYHKVLCIDLLGHGKTKSIGYVHSMDDMAEAVLHVLNFEKIKYIKCVGHSMGGYVALALAEKHPELFTSLCLMNSTFEADDEERQLLRKRANMMAQNNYEALVRTSFINLFAKESLITFESEIKAALKIALSTEVQGYIACQEGMRMRPTRYDVFKTLSAKKAIIISQKDWVVNAELLQRKLIHTDVEIVDFSEGHMSHIENKSELEVFFNQFLS